MFTITQTKEHLTAMGHGGSLNKVRNIESLFERAANTMLLKCRPVETIRTVPLTNTVHDNLFNYALPSDFNALIDIYPQANRNNLDQGFRVNSEVFNRRKGLDDQRFSIEASEGTKRVLIDWNVRSPKTLHTMDSYNGNGTWSVVGTASNLVTDTIYKYSGGGSVRFDVATTGDGIQITDMSSVDLTDEDEIAGAVIPVYIGDVTNLNSITFIFGNDLTTKYWTGVAQTTQADGTAFSNGWNIIKIPWNTATETGTVTPSTIDSLKLTFNVDAAISDIRVDNIQMSIGYPFDIKYYSKFLFRSSAGTWLSKPTSDEDSVVTDNDSFQIFLLECLIVMAHQLEGSDSGFDVNFAKNELLTLYPAYKREHPSQVKKVTQHYGGMPKFRR